MTAAGLLRIATAGSVDDGKSTLIGRLLYDSKSLFVDQLEAVERASVDRGESFTNLAFLTDGLRAEREQGITIDVAYRYFATPKRKFIIADTPGHAQYTRNMVTGASTSDLALILIDARNGVVEQTRRHAYIASLLRTPKMVVCVNKMDLVGWSQSRFEEICHEFGRFVQPLDVHEPAFVPMSALHGDNVVNRSDHCDWWSGIPLLELLEEVGVAPQGRSPARFPVQYVIRPGASTDAALHDYRGYAGSVTSGRFGVGDEVVVLPSAKPTRIAAIYGPGAEPVGTAHASEAVTLVLEDDIDVSRGDLICPVGERPLLTDTVEAIVCWMTEDSELEPGAEVQVRHTTRTVTATVERIVHRLDVNSLHENPRIRSLSLNDIGRVVIRTRSPLAVDLYRHNRSTGSFILVDPATKATIASGIVVPPEPTRVAHEASGRVVTSEPDPARRSPGAPAGRTLWFGGTVSDESRDIAEELGQVLRSRGERVYVLDDSTLEGLNSDLPRPPFRSGERVRRAGEVARILAGAGACVVVAPMPGGDAGTARARAVHREAGLAFVEMVAGAGIRDWTGIHSDPGWGPEGCGGDRNGPSRSATGTVEDAAPSLLEEVER